MKFKKKMKLKLKKKKGNKPISVDGKKTKERVFKNVRQTDLFSKPKILVT